MPSVQTTQEALRGSLYPRFAMGVSMSTEGEAVVHVAGRGSFALDAETFCWLTRLAVDSDIEARRFWEFEENRPSLEKLVACGILEAGEDFVIRPGGSGDLTYSPQVADLAARIRVPVFESVLWGAASALKGFTSRKSIYIGLFLLAGFDLFVVATVSLGAAYDAWVDAPIRMMIAVLSFMLIRLFMHELGHAAAARRFGVGPADAGFGSYLGMPVLFVDLSAADTLLPKERLQLDLAGLAMDGYTGVLLICATLLAPRFAWFTGVLAWELAAASAASLNPITRSDLNWAIRDLTGVRSFTPTWARPSELWSAARLSVHSSQRAYARAQFGLAAAFLIGMSVSSAVAIPDFLRAVTETLRHPAMLLPLLVTWIVSGLGFLWLGVSLRRAKHGNA